MHPQERGAASGAGAASQQLALLLGGQHVVRSTELQHAAVLVSGISAIVPSVL
jgi:hypothetical protein